MSEITKKLGDFRWTAIDGKWNENDGALTFEGGEYTPIKSASATTDQSNMDSIEPPEKLVQGGTVLFSENFKEGRLKLKVEFEEADYRAQGGLIIQYSPETKDLLTFVITGGSLIWKPGQSGYLFKLQSWAQKSDNNSRQQGGILDLPKVWTPLFQTGLGTNIRSNKSYEIEVSVRGSSASLFVDGVEIGRYTFPFPSLPGGPFGIFCLGHKAIKFYDIEIEAALPKAFVVMQFHTPEYESLFRDVIAPVCKSQGLEAYRADFTYLPGVVIEDIKRQITEARIIIAEITPQNANVYYEVGYADALNKPIILLSDRKENVKPFDVRSYRTIFYDNSIGGKNQIENDLKAYLQAIMNL
jgi:hypothetical protein